MSSTKKSKSDVAIRRRRDIIAISMLTFAVLNLVGLHTGAAGVVGQFLAGFWRHLVGQASDLPPLLMIVWAVAYLRGRQSAFWSRTVSIALFFLVFITFLQITSAIPENNGGLIGSFTAGLFSRAFGITGTYVVLSAIAIIALILLVDTPVAQLVDQAAAACVSIGRMLISAAVQGAAAAAEAVTDLWARLLDFYRRRRRNRKAAKGLFGREGKRAHLRQDTTKAMTGAVTGRELPTTAFTRHQPVPGNGSPAGGNAAGEAAGEAMDGEAMDTAGEEAAAAGAGFCDPFALPVRSRRKKTMAGGEEGAGVSPAAVQNSAAAHTSATALLRPGQAEPAADVAGGSPFLPDQAAEPVLQPELLEISGPDYKLPSLRIFPPSKKLSRKRVPESPDQSTMLEETLASFGVEARVVDIRRGPVVTRYELQPAPGIQVRRIVNLADDLALNLAAAGVRIEAPVPGKSVVGIEVPNKEPAIVTWRDVVESQQFTKTHSRLAMALGMDIAGNPVVGDLTNLFHLLIGGATGSGKSVCVNAIICSLLWKAKPHEVKLLMIDPKRVELAVYDGIPHLIAPVVTDPRQAAGALRWAVKEMESRYKRFAERGVRNISSYNQAILQDDEAGEELLPYIVVIIDELADLMMVSKHDVEDSICRLAQMARAAGMALIVATQRPSVDVITGLIKANVPSRIAFKVTSYQDSRTILDRAGAERLLGKGDMLYFPVGIAEPVRLQGAFISDREVQTLVDFWKNQGSPEYQDVLEPGDGEDSSQNLEDEEDELFADACRLVVETGNASISMLQRRFRIGYARAGHLMDMMEKRGIVGPFQGSKPREVLKTLDELDDFI